MRILEVAEEPLVACYGDEGVSDTARVVLSLT